MVFEMTSTGVVGNILASDARDSGFNSPVLDCVSVTEWRRWQAATLFKRVRFSPGTQGGSCEG